ncbi:MAG: Toxin-antitoxin system, toxin component, RelE family [uncultured bacterium]|uniref:Toxin-antitoxin system, toxin component, RelE family n=1 Tax=Candidatus Wolfebacteria bacterium GW2011_GWE2_44_13 TaxID=1619017 RepID=A0A0G1H8S5_9BACT|nr:MAG: Toxin-antitoxin system, toxin component, RelE family [uncultured bacterium]KKT43771.1 MAG: Toxin-antitoxin system, toxin component, RelE family [Candidatus Wolfebacteria bacterium GW2011_GWE2_44_13]
MFKTKKLDIITTSSYKKSFKKLAKSGIFPVTEIDRVVDMLASGELLDKKYKDHQLRGEYKNYRECHILNDLLLMYRIENKELVLILIDIGSHSQLFG